MARVAFLGLGVLLVLMVVVQLDAIEGRLIETTGRLGTLTERVAGQTERLEALERAARRGAMATAASPAGATSHAASTPTTTAWLHPEVANYLTPDPFPMRLPEVVEGGTITRWFGSDPKGLNYLLENGSDVREGVSAYVNESLATNHFQDPDSWAPALAERVEVTDDYREYTVYLRRGVLWHAPAVDPANPRYAWLEGDHEVTADDVKFTVDLILNPQVEASHLRNYYEDLEYCRVVDRYTVVFRWKKRTYNSISFTLGFTPMPRFLYAFDEDGEEFPPATLGLRFNEHWYNQRTVGTGPYRFVSWEQGVTLKLTRNEDYWGVKPAIRHIVWLIFTDRKTNLLKLKSREIDYARLYPPDYREEIVDGAPDSPFRDGRIKHDFFIQAGYYFIGWNLTSPLFSDARVRRAMTMCLDRKSIIGNVLMGLGVEATGPFFVASPYNDAAIEPLPYDPAAARRLLEEAGWSDGDGDGILDREVAGVRRPFEFTFLLYSGSPEWSALATIYKEALYRIGVRMSVTEAEWSLMQKRMNDRDFDCYSGGWGTSWEPDPYQIWHSSQADLPGSSNRIGFKNAEADAIIEELRSTFDRTKRVELCHRFHRIIYDEQPYTFFYARKRVLAWWDRVKRVVFCPLRPQDSSLPWYLDGGGE